MLGRGRARVQMGNRLVAEERVDKGWKGKERKGREDMGMDIGEGWTRKEKLRVDGKEN